MFYCLLPTNAHSLIDLLQLYHPSDQTTLFKQKDESPLELLAPLLFLPLRQKNIHWAYNQFTYFKHSKQWSPGEPQL